MRQLRAETLHQTILLALVAGLALALYAGYEAANPAAARACSFSLLFSCSSVLNSGHTTIAGVQDWIFGVAGFAVMLAIDIPLYRSWHRRWLLALLGLSTLGLGIAAYLASIELFVIGAFCPVCLGSYLADAIVLAACVALYRRSRAEATPEQPKADATPAGDATH